MMKFRALRVLHGDFGTVHPGEVFSVEDHVAKKLERLEARGVIMRHRDRPAIRIDRKAYTVYENKAIVPPDTKDQRRVAR